MKVQSFFIFFLGILIVLAGWGLLSGIIRRYHRDLKDGNRDREKTQETGFVIDAFHEVTKQLKEKEKELHKLKTLAEQRAENVENYNENILECVTSGVVTFDRNCRLTTINRAAEELLCLDRTRAEGMSCTDIFGDDDICRAVRDTVDRKAPSLRLETALARPNGKIWLGFNTAVLSDRQGEGLGAILSFSDLTEVKRLQEQMELRERLTALGEMSAGIAHELRNPMAVISGYLNLLSKKTDESNRAIIRDISTEIDGMNRIIGDLLTFARPASLNRVPVNIREVIESCVAGVLQATGAHSRIKTEISVHDMQVSVDEVLMRQAFGNLLQNAIEAIPDQGTIGVKARAGQHVTIQVSDTGTGISSDAVRKIFLPFFTTKDKGVGLGLALVHKIVLSHGGRIEVNSIEGRGTVFTMVLPKG